MDFQAVFIFLWYVSPTSLLLYFVLKEELKTRELPTAFIALTVILANTYLARNAINHDLSGIPFIFQPVQNWLLIGLHFGVSNYMNQKIKNKYNQEVN